MTNLLKDVFVYREYISLYSGSVRTTLGFSIVYAYIKPSPAAPGQGRYKHGFYAEKVLLILFSVLANMLNMN